MPYAKTLLPGLASNPLDQKDLYLVGIAQLNAWIQSYFGDFLHYIAEPAGFDFGYSVAAARPGLYLIVQGRSTMHSRPSMK